MRAAVQHWADPLSTEKYTSIAQVSRATAYRELTDLVALGFGAEGFQAQAEIQKQ